MSIFEAKNHPLNLFWCQLKGSAFTPVDGREMRSAYLKRFKQVYDELEKAEFPLLGNLEIFLNYLHDYYFSENATYPARDWSYYNPAPTPEPEAATNNNSELLNAILNSMLPSGRVGFSQSCLTVYRFHRRMIDNKLYLTENDKLSPISRRQVVTLLIRNHIMPTFGAILSGRDKYSKAMKAAEKLAKARNEAKRICASTDSYKKWLEKNFKQYPNDRLFFQPELLTNLEAETANENISILANDLSTSSIDQGSKSL